MLSESSFSRSPVRLRLLGWRESRFQAEQDKELFWFSVAFAFQKRAAKGPSCFLILSRSSGSFNFEVPNGYGCSVRSGDKPDNGNKLTPEGTDQERDTVVIFVADHVPCILESAYSAAALTSASASWLNTSSCFAAS